MKTDTKTKLENGLVIYAVTILLGLAMAFLAQSMEFAFVVPVLLGTFICYVLEIFGSPFILGEPDVSEERT